MAKFDELDPRWIVAERADGTNVKNWHWTEKDCTAWSRTRLAELTQGVSLFDDTVSFVQLTQLTSVKGEAFVNNRKNKLFASFDLNLKLAYCGEVKGENSGTGSGAIEVPNFSDEQSPEEWEFRVSPSEESAPEQLLKEDILRKGRTKLRALLSTYVEELKAGVPIERQAQQQEAVPSAQNVAPTAKPKRHVQATSAGFHELHLKETYHASPQDICDCFLVAGKLQTFTQSPAKVDAREGGEFSWFDGAVSGRFVEIQSLKKLVFVWRFSNWSKDHFSRVTVELENPEPGQVILSLHQTGIPEEDAYGNANVLAVTETGWKDRILTRIKAVFGYGI